MTRSADGTDNSEHSLATESRLPTLIVSCGCGGGGGCFSTPVLQHYAHQMPELHYNALLFIFEQDLGIVFFFQASYTCLSPAGSARRGRVAGGGASNEVSTQLLIRPRGEGAVRAR